MSDTRLLVVHARSPLHCGTGQATAAVDLPIARNRATRHPLVPGSSIKGALRNVFRDRSPEHEIGLFGPNTQNASEHAGSIAFSDAQLVLMPVRSVRGTFAWVTCPWALATIARDAKLCGLSITAPPTVVPDGEAWVTEHSALASRGDDVILEEFDLKRTDRPELRKWSAELGELLFDKEWAKMLEKRLCVVSDDVFGFLVLHATDIVTRVHIDESSGTAADGQLWTEENLPSESILVAPLQATPFGPARGSSPDELFDQLKAALDRPVQLGGKATVGRGRCDLRIAGGAA